MRSTKRAWVACVMWIISASMEGVVAEASSVPSVPAARHAAMTRETFQGYLTLVSNGDERHADYYTSDVVLGRSNGEFRGRQAVLDYYRDLQRRLTTTLTPGEVVIDNERGLMGAELTIRMESLGDGVQVGARTLDKGDVLTIHDVMFYGLAGGKITSIRSTHDDYTLLRAGSAAALAAAHVAAESGPQSAAPSAESGGIMTYEKYSDYLRLFSAFNPDFLQYYAPDVVFSSRPAPEPLHGRQAILDLYTPLRRHLDEHITLTAVVIDNEHGTMVAEITNRMVATGDNVKLPSATMNTGDVGVGSGVVFYGLRNGLITLIREGISGETLEPARKQAAHVPAGKRAP